PALSRCRSGPHRRGAAAGGKERTLASRQGDASADRETGGIRRCRSGFIRTRRRSSGFIRRGRSRMIARLSPPSAPHFAALPPLSLYVHIPWCVRKCPYCDFNSHAARGEVPEAAYIDALVSDLELALPSIWGRHVSSVFIGGGTPSLFSAEAIDRLLASIRARIPLQADAEITLEANPGTFERTKFAGFRDAGVNRLSLGVQSFNPKHLRALGRVHDADEARGAADAALAIFGNVNLDLMVAL